MARDRTIQTPWGGFTPAVELFPLIYILVVYGFVYFLPFGIFRAWRVIGDDTPAEWLQFAAYFAAFLCSLRVLWMRRRSCWSLGWLSWLLMTLFCGYVSAEEISWGERLSGWGVGAIRAINAQGETNLHNLPALQNYMHFSFIAIGLFFGYIGWRFLPAIDALPGRRFSLYFLIVALFYFYFDLSWMTLGERIRNDQEVIEVLMAIGLFRHASSKAFPAAKR